MAPQALTLRDLGSSIDAGLPAVARPSRGCTSAAMIQSMGAKVSDGRLNTPATCVTSLAPERRIRSRFLVGASHVQESQRNHISHRTLTAGATAALPVTSIWFSIGADGDTNPQCSSIGVRFTVRSIDVGARGNTGAC